MMILVTIEAEKQLLGRCVMSVILNQLLIDFLDIIRADILLQSKYGYAFKRLSVYLNV